MRMQKKVTRKEDGRLLVYYHFPNSATADEAATFAAIEALDPAVEFEAQSQAVPSPSGEDKPRV